MARKWTFHQLSLHEGHAAGQPRPSNTDYASVASDAIAFNRGSYVFNHREMSTHEVMVQVTVAKSIGKVSPIIL